MKCYEMFATSCHFGSGDTTDTTDLTKVAGSKLEIGGAKTASLSKLGGSRRWHSKNLHFTAWSTDFLTRRCVTACCYGMLLRRFWWNGDPRDEAVCIQIIQRPIWPIYINKHQINYHKLPHLQPASSLEPILDLDLQLLRYKWSANVCRVSARAMFFSVLLDAKGSGHVEHRSNPLTVQIESWNQIALLAIYGNLHHWRTGPDVSVGSGAVMILPRRPAVKSDGFCKVPNLLCLGNCACAASRWLQRRCGKADKEWAWQQTQLQMISKLVYSGHLSSRYYWLLKDRE